MSKIAFIGLGMMGAPMAHLLHQAGHSLTVKDANPAVVAQFLSEHAGATAASSDEQIASNDFIITMLPSSSIVDVVVGPLLPHLRSGTTIIEMSSADPMQTRELAAKVNATGAALIDAPVSGGVKKAVDGSLAIMVGGEEANVKACLPVLESMGWNITHVGRVASGHALKALNNYVSAAALIATAEAIHAGKAFGIDPITIVDVIQASTGRNNTTENKAKQYMLNGAFNSGFSLALQAKDVGIAAALGEAMQVNMELGKHVAALTSEASESLGPKADHTELYRYVQTD
ncbi:NAD(P)-dependent oxidoreductase [Candidimonas sp. SYP-B2681]|uniref:NAD(P)-dependent oxidoreductase n=1 Tax=Candidimonas sp. SYP-B2681 TaxID=2497686 RepID=UPI000F88DCE3|nr:NAD(P)-dependent oxidoreductase [Candidimonas sp. SYP-B2681]RTZ45533.1 NAD(P)-dependent oxidoreductase [Candidimonas sp. SYP-B2681]